MVGGTGQQQIILYPRGLPNIVLSSSTYHKRGFVCGTLPLWWLIRIGPLQWFFVPFWIKKWNCRMPYGEFLQNFSVLLRSPEPSSCSNKKDVNIQDKENEEVYEPLDLLYQRQLQLTPRRKSIAPRQKLRRRAGRSSRRLWCHWCSVLCSDHEGLFPGNPLHSLVTAVSCSLANTYWLLIWWLWLGMDTRHSKAFNLHLCNHSLPGSTLSSDLCSLDSCTAWSICICRFILFYWSAWPGDLITPNR
jgi:hypothetical protein